MILDTNALSAWAEEDSAAQALIATQSEVCLPVIVLGEFRFGLRFSRRGREIIAKIEILENQIRVLAIEKSTAALYAEIRYELKAAGTPIPENDLWIAALVRQHQLPIMSRDTHFDVVRGLRRVTW